MLKKPAGKLSGLKRHQLRLTLIFIILPEKTDRLSIKRLNSRITNSHPMRISTKIANHMLRRLKGFLTKNNPFLCIKAIYKRSKITGYGK